jgi:hypothetical protein
MALRVIRRRRVRSPLGAASNACRPGGRWHRTLKNRILLENDFFKEDLEAQIAAFVEHSNHRRYHESPDNLTPEGVYFGRGQTILLERERIKRDTIRERRLNHQAKAAQINPQTEPETPFFPSPKSLKSFDDGQEQRERVPRFALSCALNVSVRSVHPD